MKTKKKNKDQYKDQKIIKSIVLSAVFLIVTLFYLIPYLTAEYSVQSITAYAKNSVEQIKLTRAYYVKSVVGDIKKYAPEISFSYAHEGVDGTIPLPTTLIHDLSEIFSKDTGLTYNLYSEYPFKNRADRVLTPFQKEAIAATKLDPNGMYIKRDVVDGKEVLHVATTDYMTSKSCVSCHNSHPDRTWGTEHWKIGDKRGILEVTVPMDVELGAHKEFRNYIILVIFLISASVLFYLFQVLRGREKELLTVAGDLESEVETLSHMVDNYVIVSKTDPRGMITYVSQAFVNISGYSREELIGRPHNIVRHESVPSSVYVELWKTIKNKKTWSGDLANKSKDGGTYYVHATIFPIFDIENNVIEYIAFRDDITERILSQKALEKEKKLNEIVSDNQQSILLMTNIEDEVMSINKKFFEVFDFKDLKDFKKEHRGICELFIEKEGYLRPTTEESNWIDLPLKYPLQMHKALILDKYGNERIFSVRIKEANMEGNILYVSTFTDITELEEAIYIAKSSEEAKTAFLANMSHEIRTPMNGISGFLQLLSKTSLNDKQTQYLSIIETSMDNLLKIIQDILDFSKIESGKLQLSLEEINPFKYFEKSLKIFSFDLEKKAIQYTISIDKDSSKCLYIDTLRISQVLNNLLGNAIKFTDTNGSIEVSIKLLEQHASYDIMKFSVSDTGIGIPKQKQASIFEAFSQADSSTTREFGGTGLGLSISSTLVGLMGGKLELESIEGEGSTFLFTIKLKKCNSQNGLLSQDTTSQVKDSILKVVIADDYEMNQIVMGEFLKEYGITDTTYVNHGEDLISLLEKEQFDLIFMDINLTIMNAIDATQELRNKNVKTPIIALTTNVLEGDEARFLSYGMDGYLSRPIEANKLNSLLDYYIQLKEKNE